jgi:hypothetical protein
MAIDTLATLRTAVANWLARDDLTAYVDDLIMAGEKYLVRKVRVPEMETAFSDTMSSGTVSVPTGFLSWKWASISGSPDRFLKVRTSAWIMENYPMRSSDGKPFFIARDGSSFIFGPFPDGAYTVLGTYYKRPTTILSAVNDLFSLNPDLYLFAALAESVAFLKDDQRVPMWIAKRDAVIRSVNEEADEMDETGSLQTTVDFAE